MKLIKNIIEFIFPPSRTVWKVRYVAGNEKYHRINYLLASTDVDAIAKLQKKMGAGKQITIISCKEFKSSKK